MLRILAWVEDDIYALFDDRDNNVTEFTSSEVVLLDRFIHVVGCEADKLQVAVLRVRSLITTCVGKLSFMSIPREEALQLEEKGYLVMYEDDSDDLVSSIVGLVNFCSPSLLVRFGVYAVVTDKGRLLYLHTRDKERVVLGDFCSCLCDRCISVESQAVLVFDDRIKFMSLDWVTYRVEVDVHNVSSGTVLAVQLEHAMMDDLISCI